MTTVSKEEEKLGCITEEERELAHSALSNFHSKDYASCLSNLKKLENKKDDFKVLHNTHVAEYYIDELKGANKFYKKLADLLKQFDLHVDNLDDVDYCVAYFNIGILHYQQKQYSKALVIIERIYKFIEPLNETLGRHVGLLLIELYIYVRQVDKALSLITYFHDQVSNRANANQKDAKAKGTSDKKHKSIDRFLNVLERYKIRCNLLMHSLRAASADIKRLHSADEKDIEVLYLLANQQYLEGKFEDAMKSLGKVPADALSYMSNGESSNALFYNNIGVIHYAMGKPNLACHYYQQALAEETVIHNKPTNEIPLYMLGVSKYHEIMLNLGIAMLHAGKAAQAFECLVIAVRKYHRNCRLWLRLAECCIQLHKPSNAVDFDISKKQKELIVDVLGTKSTQKVILNTRLTQDKKYSGEAQSYAVPVATLEFATLCLKNAEFVLASDANVASDSMLLLPGVSLPSSTVNSISSPSSVMLPEDKTHLKNSILVAYAYVSLCVGNYVIALSKAEELLKQPKISGSHRLLAHFYAAECLVLEDKLNEALGHLNPELIKDIALECPNDDLEDEIQTKTIPPTSWFPNTLQSAMAVMQYNMAIIKAIRGQYDQASALLNQLWTTQTNACQVPAQIIMLVLYIKIQVGQVDVAKNFIRKYSRRVVG